MKNVKVEKINDWYVEGYTLGGYYLVKNLNWFNKIDWILTTKCKRYCDYERNMAIYNN